MRDGFACQLAHVQNLAPAGSEKQRRGGDQAKLPVILSVIEESTALDILASSEMASFTTALDDTAHALARLYRVRAWVVHRNDDAFVVCKKMFKTEDRAAPVAQLPSAGQSMRVPARPCVVLDPGM
jgi:hypothetical protein